MIEKEFEKIITDIETTNDTMLSVKMSGIALHYDRLLSDVKKSNYQNKLIKSKMPIAYEMGVSNIDKIKKEILSSAKEIVRELTKSDAEKAKDQEQSDKEIDVFDNVIVWIKSSAIENKKEMITDVARFKDEISKGNPDKEKLKHILQNLTPAGDEVTALLLAEVGRKVLGL